MEKKNHSKLLQDLDLLIGNALRNQIFSACSLGFYKSGNGNIYREILNYGKTGLGKTKDEVNEKSFFDLASLTKPLVTSLVFLFLVENGVLKNEDNLSKYFKNIDLDKKQIKLFHLLTHTSGLPAHKPYFIELENISFDARWNYVLKKILSEKLIDFPGKTCLYSDLGFILLGCIIERATGEKLDHLWENNILKPLEIANKRLSFAKGISEESIFVETGICGWSKKKLEGLVNDDNCRALGGVAGHAGLFGTISGLVEYVEKLSGEITGKTNFLQFKEQTIKTFFKREKISSWINGFDTPAEVCSSSGNQFSEMSFGHLGFTGTSFWMDLTTGCGVVLLTNRILCGEDLGPIRKIRPLIHNLVMYYLKNIITT